MSKRDSDPFLNLTDEDRYAAWLEWSEESYKASHDMEAHVYYLQEFIRWHENNPDECLLSTQARLWISHIAARSIGSYARALADNSNDSHSLVPLVKDMIKYPHLLTSERWVDEAVKAKESNCEANGLFAELEKKRRQKEYLDTWGGDPCDQNKKQILGKLLSRLPRSNHAIERWVTSTIAHSLRTTNLLPVTYEQLFDSCQAILEVTREIHFKLTWVHIEPMGFSNPPQWPTAEYLLKKQIFETKTGSRSRRINGKP